MLATWTFQKIETSSILKPIFLDKTQLCWNIWAIIEDLAVWQFRIHVIKQWAQNKPISIFVSSHAFGENVMQNIFYSSLLETVIK